MIRKLASNLVRKFQMGDIKPFIIIRLADISRMIRGEVSTETLVKRGMIVGENFGRQGGCRLDASFPFLIEIGDNVGLSTDVTILTHDNSLKRHIGILKLGRVTIGNNVFVGAKSLILPNVHIGNNVVIGAGSVVTRDIPDNSVVAGNPARLIRPTTEYVDKYKDKMKSYPILDHSYSPLRLNNEKKTYIKPLLSKEITP